MDRLQTPPVVTSDIVYLRLIGDRRSANYTLTEPKKLEIGPPRSKMSSKMRKMSGLQ